MVRLEAVNGIYEVIPSRSERFFECQNRKEAKDKLIELGVEEKEVDIAIEQLTEHNHSIAHFGINGTFIYSER